MKSYIKNIHNKLINLAIVFALIALTAALAFAFYLNKQQNNTGYSFDFENSPSWQQSLERTQLIDSFDSDRSSSSILNISAIKPLNSAELSAISLQEAYREVARRTLPGVVSIQVTVNPEAASKNPAFNDEFLNRFFGYDNQRKQRQAQHFGSGFLISSDGYLISNHHVIRDAAKIVVLFYNNDKEFTAKVIGTDPDTDIALLKIEEKGNFPYLSLGNSDAVHIGDIAIAIGNPFGFSHTFTAGVISAKGRKGIANKYENFIQTDVAINPGNSGGPLLNLNGAVIAINSNILSNSNSNAGIGFSIPINMAKYIVDNLKRDGKVRRGWIGIYYANVTSDIAEALSIKKRGVIINSVIENSPAARSGLKEGDILTALNGKSIKNGNELLYEISKIPVNTRVLVRLLRDGKVLSKQFSLEERKDQVSSPGSGTGQQGSSAPQESISRAGLSIRNMLQSEFTKFGKKQAFGVIITKLSPESPLAAAGISEGDIIEQLNKKQTPSLNVFKREFAKLKKNSKALFKVRRGRSLYFIIVQI